MAYLVTPTARLSYPNLFKPRANKDKPGSEPKFSACLIFDKAAQATPEFKAMMAAVQAAAFEKFGANAKNLNLRNPFRKAEEKMDADGKFPDGMEAGFVFINCSSAMAPGVVDAKVQPILDQREIYAGCYVKAAVNAYGYDNSGNKGVSFGLNHVQKVKDGKPLGNTSRPQDAFKPVDADEDDASSTAPADSIFG
jgi:hypothetical protein